MKKTLHNGVCLGAKAFKFQTILVTMSSMKRKRNVLTIETKLEIIDQPAKGVSGSFPSVHRGIGVIQLIE